MKPLLWTLGLAMLLSGYSFKKTVLVRPVAGGTPIEAVFTTGIFASGGDVTETLEDGSTATGRWSQISSGTTLQSIFVTTPSGPIKTTAIRCSVSSRGQTVLALSRAPTATANDTWATGNPLS